MQLTGLGLQAALTLGAIFGGILLILYILKMRRRRVEVPFSPLWSRVLVDKQATSWLQRLKRLFSLLLWCLIGFLLLVALTNPQPEAELEQGKSIVILVDTSASMGATEIDPSQTHGSLYTTRWREAQDKVLELIEDMGTHDRAMLIAMDGQVRSVNGDFTDNRKELRDAIETLKPSATEARPLEGLRTAVDTLTSRRDPHIYLISDGAFGGFELPERLVRDEISFEHILIGESVGNIAVSGFNIRRYLSNKLDYEVYVQVRNYFEREVVAELNLYNLAPRPDGGFTYRIIEKRTLTLAPGSSELRFYENLALGSDHLAARVDLVTEGLRDGLTMDNEAYVLVPKFEQARVLVVTHHDASGQPANLFLQAALLLNENFEVDFKAPEDPLFHPGGVEAMDLRKLPTLRPGYDVVIFDNSLWEEGEIAIAPEATIPGNFLYINPKGETSPFQTKEVIEPLVERVNRKHPIARWLVMKNLNIIRGSRIRTKPKDSVVVRAIDGPLVVARREPGRNLVAVGFSLVESDIVFRVALPVLLINSVDWFTDESNSLIEGYRTGQNWHIPVPSSAEAINIRAPDGDVDKELPTHEGKAVYYGAHTGFYALANAEDSGFGGGWEIAANFSSPRESEIRPAAEPLPEQEGVKPAIAKEELDPRIQRWAWLLETLTYEIWLYCVFLVLGLLVIEWFTYHRRWTV